MKQSAAVSFRDPSSQRVVVGLLVLDSAGGGDDLGPTLRMYRGVVISKAGELLKPVQCLRTAACVQLQTMGGNALLLRFESLDLAEEWEKLINKWAREASTRIAAPGRDVRRPSLAAVAHSAAVRTRVGYFEKGRIKELEKEVLRLKLIVSDRDREIKRLRKDCAVPSARSSSASTSTAAAVVGTGHSAWLTREHKREIRTLRDTVTRMTNAARFLTPHSEPVVSPQAASKRVASAMAELETDEALLEAMLDEEVEIEHDAARIGDAIEVAMDQDAGAAPQPRPHQLRTSVAVKAQVPPRQRRLPSDELLSNIVGATSSSAPCALSNAQLIAQMKQVKRDHTAAKQARDRRAVKRAARAYALLQAERKRRKTALQGKRIIQTAFSGRLE